MPKNAGPRFSKLLLSAKIEATRVKDLPAIEWAGKKNEKKKKVATALRPRSHFSQMLPPVCSQVRNSTSLRKTRRVQRKSGGRRRNKERRLGRSGRLVCLPPHFLSVLRAGRDFFFFLPTTATSRVKHVCFGAIRGSYSSLHEAPIHLSHQTQGPWRD